VLKGQLDLFKAAGFSVKDGEKSIHDAESIRFAKEILKVGQWHENVLRNSLSLDFKEEPVQYSEKNNVSALKNMQVLKDKVAEWVKDGHVEKLAEPVHESYECGSEIRPCKG
jgi:hypothetical protein